MLECPLDIPKSFKDKYDYQEKIVMENITIKDIVEACSGQLLCGDENKVIKEFSIDSVLEVKIASLFRLSERE